MFKKKFILSLFLVCLTFFVIACQPGPVVDDFPVSSGTPDAVSTPEDFSSYQEQATIENIQINLMESFPLQVSVLVSGNLPDGCTSIVGTKTVKLNGNTFEIHVFTERMIDALCTQALIPFEEVVTLDVYGLDAGTYLVKVYDLEESFTFDMDNK